MQTENKNTEAILVLERQIYNYQRANAELQTSLGERSLMQKYGLYLLLVGWFLALEFMKNWMGFFVEITDVAYIPIVIVFAVLLVCWNTVAPKGGGRRWNRLRRTGTDAMNSGSRLRHSEGECDQY